MTVYHIDATQTALIIGPARIDLVTDNEPVLSTVETPEVTSLEPPSAVAGSPDDIQLIVEGTGFNEASKIVMNNYDEPTTMLSPTQLRTIVKPSIFTVPADVPVKVRTGGLVSNELMFQFTEVVTRSRNKK